MRRAIASWLLVILTACSNAPLDGEESVPATEKGPPPSASEQTTDAGDGPSFGEIVPVDAPGVTDTQIRIGAVTSAAEQAGLKLSDTVPGFEARIALENQAGGVHGRELVLAVNRDDGIMENDLTVTQLVTQDDVFAAAPVAPVLFTGVQELISDQVPTFGYNTSTDFQGAPNLFGFRGYLCYTCPVPAMPWLWRELERDRIGVLALGGIPQTQSCVDQIEAGVATYGTAEIVFEDAGIALGQTDFSAQVTQMIERDVDIVANCMDVNALLAVGEEMRKQRHDAIQMLFVGYEPELISAYSDALEGAWAMTTFTPFEIESPPPGLAAFLAAMEEIDGPLNEFSLSGWVAADLLIEGLNAAGPDFDRQKVIESINQITDYNAGGIIARQDWTIQHDGPAPESCVVFGEVVDGVLEPRFGAEGMPFSCFDTESPVLPDEPVYSAS